MDQVLLIDQDTFGKVQISTDAYGSGSSPEFSSVKVGGELYAGSDSDHIGSLDLYDTSGDTVFNRHWSGGESDFIINHNDATQLIIKESGYVGIGTTAPKQKLTIGGKVSGDVDAAQRTYLASFNAPDNAFLEIENTDTQKPAGIILTNVTTKKWTIAKEGDDHSLQIKDATDLVVARFEQGGNVGIGTANAERRLDVRFNEDNSSSTNYRNVDGIRIWNTDDTVGQSICFDVYHICGSAAGITAERVTADVVNLHFINESKDGVPNSIMSLIYDGKVGIGTKSPSTKLEIAGNVRINGGEDTHSACSMV